jgi:hypothetical protein
MVPEATAAAPGHAEQIKMILDELAHAQQRVLQSPDVQPPIRLTLASKLSAISPRPCAICRRCLVFPAYFAPIVRNALTKHGFPDLRAETPHLSGRPASLNQARDDNCTRGWILCPPAYPTAARVDAPSKASCRPDCVHQRHGTNEEHC